MQCITVKYLGPTNNRGSRYKATCQAGSATLAYDYSLGREDNAWRAAKAIIDRLEWHYGKWYCGEDAAGNWQFVCATKWDEGRE